MKATARAHPNIALVKYWGKRDERLILPHQSSVSVTLGPLSVTTTVEFSGKPGADEVEINSVQATGAEFTRVRDVLRWVRQESGQRKLGAAKVVSKGDFPAAAGLASSAAAFAALSVAARAAAGLKRNERSESILARRGSGSASRSVAGGFVRWNRGRRRDGLDSFGEQLFSEAHWPQLRLLVGMVSTEEKEVKSRDGMKSTVKSSPYYPAWVRQAERDAREIVKWIRRRDLEGVGALAEQNAWAMHASAMGARPPLCYLKPQTVAVIEACRLARKQGIGVWFTLDAGPNPVLLTTEPDVPRATALVRQCGASEVIVCEPSAGTQTLDAHLF